MPQCVTRKVVTCVNEHNHKEREKRERGEEEEEEKKKKNIQPLFPLMQQSEEIRAKQAERPYLARSTRPTREDEQNWARTRRSTLRYSCIYTRRSLPLIKLALEAARCKEKLGWCQLCGSFTTHTAVILHRILRRIMLTSYEEDPLIGAERIFFSAHSCKPGTCELARERIIFSGLLGFLPQCTVAAAQQLGVSQD